MSSKYATTQFNRLNRVKAQLKDVYARAIAFHFTADILRDKESAVFESADFRKLPAYERGYLRGTADALRQDIWNNRVIWRLGPQAGPTRTVHETWTEEMSILCRQPGQLYGGHFWIVDGNPSDKVFTEYKATN